MPPKTYGDVQPTPFVMIFDKLAVFAKVKRPRVATVRFLTGLQFTGAVIPVSSPADLVMYDTPGSRRVHPSKRTIEKTSESSILRGPVPQSRAAPAASKYLSGP
jgi:hypothetical protein